MRRSLVLVLAAGLAPVGAQADRVEDRLDALEKQQAEVYHTLTEKKAAGLHNPLTERLVLSGFLEVEVGYERVEVDGEGAEEGSDLAVATAQLGFGAKVTDEVSATLVFLFEEGEEEGVVVDEATVDCERGIWNGRIGRQYLPFGAFHSHFVSDPMTLELGETQETALLVGYGAKAWGLSGFLFKGVADRDGDDDHIGDWGVSMDLIPLEFLEVGASLLSDLADSDLEIVGETYDRRVMGWSAYGVLGMGSLEVVAEVLGAAQSFSASDLDVDGDGSGDRPLAWNLEIAYPVASTVELAARVEGSREVAGLPELQYGVAVSWGGWEATSLSFEYLHGEFDGAFSADGDGNGLKSRDLVTAQLAVEF